MSRFDEAGAGLKKEPGLPSKQETDAISIARRKDQTIGKFAREAKRNGDLRGYLEAVGAGYTNYGIENTEDKNARYREAGHQRGFAGSAAVGGQQGAGGAQQPAGGVSGPTQAGRAPVEGRDAQGRPISMLDEEGRPVSPINGSRPAPASGAAPTGTQPAAPAMSAAEQSKQATLDKTLAGNFGKVAQARAQAKQSEGTYDSTPGFDSLTEGRTKFVDAYKGSAKPSDQNLLGRMDGDLEKKAMDEGSKLGLSEDQMNDTFSGEKDLSPKAIAARAKSRKDERAKEAYDKEFKISDDYIEKAIAGLGDKFTDEQKAAIRKNMAGLKPEQRKEMADRGIADTEKANAETTRKAQEAKDLIPGVIEEMRGLRDDRNTFVSKQKEAQNLWTRREKEKRGIDDWGKATPEQLKDFNKSAKEKWGDKWDIERPGEKAYEEFQEGTDFLDKFLNEGKFKKAPVDISSASNSFRKGMKELDVLNSLYAI